ncbi:MAG: hypothetical protein U0132_16200 [Gemmatimonadaceae bacterium]
MRKTGLWILALLAAVPLDAQTVRPAVVEYPEVARGKFELVNETVFPMTVVLEPRGFRVDATGELFDEPFDTARVHLKLSAMSFKIPPLQSYTVFYEASASQLPAWFQVISAMSGARTSNGLNVRIELPHVIYLLQKQPLRRTDVAVRSFAFDSTAKRAIVELENTSDALGRVLMSEVAGDGHTATPGGGFPLFPQSRRRVEIPWTADAAPEHLFLRFANFTVEERRKSGDR